MSSGFDTSQLNALVADLGDAPASVLPRARVAVQKASADIKRDAQIFAPVDLGNLRASITYETRQTSSAVEGEIGPSAEYGGFVEFGTTTMAPAAYMGPAFDRNAWMFEKAIAEIAEQAL